MISWKFEKNDHNLPFGHVKCDIRVLGGCRFGFFVGFWLVLSLYALATYCCYTLFCQYAYANNTLMLLTVIPHSLTVDIWLMTQQVSGGLDSLSLMESKWCDYVKVELTLTSNCFPHPYWTHTKWMSTLICYPWAYSISLTQLLSSLGDKTVAGSNRSCISSTSFGIQIITFALCGLEEPFFQLRCCFSFLFWREIGFGFTYYLCT